MIPPSARTARIGLAGKGENITSILQPRFGLSRLFSEVLEHESESLLLNSSLNLVKGRGYGHHSRVCIICRITKN